MAAWTGYKKGVMKIRDMWNFHTRTFRTFETMVHQFNITPTLKYEDYIRAYILRAIPMDISARLSHGNVHLNNPSFTHQARRPKGLYMRLLGPSWVRCRGLNQFCVYLTINAGSCSSSWLEWTSTPPFSVELFADIPFQKRLIVVQSEMVVLRTRLIFLWRKEACLQNEVQHQTACSLVPAEISSFSSVTVSRRWKKKKKA